MEQEQATVILQNASMNQILSRLKQNIERILFLNSNERKDVKS